MSDIKTKPKGTIKKLDKEIVNIQKFKNNLITTKEKISEITINDENNTPEEYASAKVQHDISNVSRKSIEKSNELGKKSLEKSQENFIKGKQKIEMLKNRIKDKKEQNTINTKDNRNKAIRKVPKHTIKTEKNVTSLTKKSIKTTEQVAKNSEKVAKESIKVSQRLARATQHIVQSSIKGVKVAIKATITTIKSLITTTKALITSIIAGGWIAIVIVLVIALIGGFIAVVFNGNGDENYDSSQIPNSEIILVAKAQIGNEGGDKFWKWYGFEEHVQWCACFVSWCANECGYIEKGIIPKFSVCTDGIKWFKEKNQWNDRGENYYPIIGDIIFFDWYDENGNQDGTSDHVGIVTRIDITNRNIYTIEGNTSNKCAERMYSFDDIQIIGYGSPKYE